MSALDKLRAPSSNAAVLAVPPLADAAALIARNRHVEVPATILGVSWNKLRRDARQEAIAAAQSYVQGAGEPLPDLPPMGATPSLVMGGHQPALFHPGVWIKNFAINQLAKSSGAIAINLVVDNDTVKDLAVRVPYIDGSRSVSVAFDQAGSEIPFEERLVVDETSFATFADRVAEITSKWNYQPMLADFWKVAMGQAPATPLLGERLARARRAFERQWGCHNLELPVSSMCSTMSFAWFACHWLSEFPRFHSVYNQAVRDYRRRHGLRSPNHPVPDLQVEDEWLEAPLWAWRSDKPERNRVMARTRGDTVELRFGNQVAVSLPVASHNPLTTVEAFQDLGRQGWKIRTRALTTTLYARLFLADLFVHGIGGGKYDEVTDRIIREFYAIEPPGFLVLSATLWLPLPRAEDGKPPCGELAQTLRDIHWNPQRHLPPSATGEASPQALAEEKARWIHLQPPSRAGRRERFWRLHQLTERLRHFVTDRETPLRKELEQCYRRLEREKVLNNREYAFCLFPAEQLRAFCTRFL